MIEPGINGSGIGAFTQLVCLPGRTSALAALPLWALERAAGLAEVVCVVLRSSASFGARGILELRRQLGTEPVAPHAELGIGAGALGAMPALAGNLIPAAGEQLVEGHCAAESELVWDLRQLFASPELPVDVSAVQVGVERCDGFALSVLLKRPLSPAGAAQAMGAVQGIRVVGSPTGPTPLEVAGTDEVHVGRIRTGSRGPCSLSFFAVGDQLRMGAVSSALAVAARLPACG
jgi:aspartate-semialdehyde dehydrogenase